jgi:hypothetical protein
VDLREPEMDNRVRRIRGAIDTTLTPPGTQYGATQGKPGKRNPLGIGDLQPCANLCNTRIITRNEQVSGSSPLVGSLFLPGNPAKMRNPRCGCRGFCKQYVISRLSSQGLVSRVGVLQMGAVHNRWRRPILWYGPFDRCAWVSADAASSKSSAQVPRR